MNPINTLPPPPPVRPVRPVGNEINILDYVSVIIRRWKIVALALIVIFTIVAYKTFSIKPIYQATSTIRLLSEQDSLGRMSQGYWVDPAARMSTEIATMKSRSIAEKVAERLHLNWQVAEKSKGFSFKILEFISSAADPVYRIKLISGDTFEIRDKKGNLIGQGQAGVLFSKDGFNLLLTDLSGKVGDTCELTLIPLQEAAMQIQGGFNATEFGKQSEIILASYTSTDPVYARDMVNAFVQSYIDNTIMLKSEQTKKTLQFIEAQLKELRGDLDNSENKLQNYKSRAGFVDLGSEAGVLVTKASELENKLFELEVKKTELLATYTPTHRAVKAVQQQIAGVRKKLAAYKKEIKNLPAVEQNLAGITRVAKVNSENYTFLLQKREEARIAMESTISNLNVVDAAVIPSAPIIPNVRKNLLLGFLAGLGLGIMLAFLLEYLDDTIKDADQAKRVTGIPLLGSIPQIGGNMSRKKGLPRPEEVSRITGGEAGQELIIPNKGALISQSEPRSVATESFRALRTSLHFSAINKDKKVMIFTSTFPREGKSVISSNTAVVTAQTGARVLMVDCDLRRSSLHEKFHFSKTPGLSEILTRDVTYEEAIHKTEIPNLDLVCAGTTPPNPSELLGSEAMRKFLLTQREKYDYIMIDAPPVLAVTDAPVLTTVSDIVILVMEAGRVPIKAAQHMREILARLNAPVAGLVLNDKTGKGEHYSYYGHGYYSKAYGYRSGYGYGYYSDEEPEPTRKLRRWAKFIKYVPDKLRRRM